MTDRGEVPFCFMEGQEMSTRQMLLAREKESSLDFKETEISDL